jgi:hypothetical protein
MNTYFSLPDKCQENWGWLHQFLFHTEPIDVNVIPNYSIGLVHRFNPIKAPYANWLHILFHPIPEVWHLDLHYDYGHRYVIKDALLNGDGEKETVEYAKANQAKLGLKIDKIDKNILNLFSYSNGLSLYCNSISIFGINLPCPQKFGIEPHALSCNFTHRKIGQRDNEICVAYTCNDDYYYFSSCETGLVRMVKNYCVDTSFEWLSFPLFVRSIFNHYSQYFDSEGNFLGGDIQQLSFLRNA